MISTLNIREKEVINTFDGKSLGFVDDVEISIEKGEVEGVVIFGQRGFLGIFKGEEDRFVPWTQIRRIGDDVILAEVPTGGPAGGWDLRPVGSATRGEAEKGEIFRAYTSVGENDRLGRSKGATAENKELRADATGVEPEKE